MGIHHYIFAVSEPDLARITADPPLVHHLFDCEPGSRAASDLPRTVFESADAWGALDFALTGDLDSADDPTGFLLTWGAPIGDIDVGYGPARALTREQVQQVSDILTELTPDAFAKRIDLAAFQAEGVYRAESFHEEDLVQLYAELREFVAQAVTGKLALVVALA